MKIERLTLELEKNTEQPKIKFNSYAYMKLQAFLKTEFAKKYEFMCIGEVVRDKNIYTVMNLHIIPQMKNGSAYCETDDEKYAIWLQENYKPDERKLVRLHAHSHVNMATSPSGTDNDNIYKMMKYVKDYFIQMIFNLKDSITLNLYQREDMLIYKDLPYTVILDNEIEYDPLSNMFTNIKDMSKYKPCIVNNIVVFTDGLEFDLASQQFYAYDKNLIISQYDIFPFDKEKYDKLIETSQKELKNYEPTTTTYSTKKGGYKTKEDSDYYEYKYQKYLLGD